MQQTEDSAAALSIPEGMSWIAGGVFQMGSDSHYPEEHPARLVRVGGFWMDRCTITNAQFARFVAATGYKTIAERPLDPALYPHAIPGMLVLAPARRGGDSSIEGLESHPVVHVAFEDAEAYAAWAGKSLPTESEWERAARGGLEGKEFVWAATSRQTGATWRILGKGLFHGATSRTILA